MRKSVVAFAGAAGLMRASPRPPAYTTLSCRTIASPTPGTLAESSTCLMRASSSGMVLGATNLGVESATARVVAKTAARSRVAGIGGGGGGSASARPNLRPIPRRGYTLDPS